ncbi:MAG: NAD-dependent malic enzyme [Chrysiogenetes bacterium]|nr:NAD-dependent malic enzyme [Chrysiogenetes bacterium]
MFSKNLLIRTLRCKNRNTPGVLGKLTTLIGETECYVGEIRTLEQGSRYTMRDIDVLFRQEEELDHLVKRIREELPDLVTLLEVRDEVLSLHQDGKIKTVPRFPVMNLGDLRKVYTPGVANVSRLIAEDVSLAERYTWATRTVAICTNGSRVLGLGAIGPLASLPVMEGKAALLSQFTGLNAVPILLETRDPKEFVDTILHIEKSFGAIHLEDIETPQCFEIEDRLIEALDKPVMHDDQHGTAVVALAAMISACQKTGKDPGAIRIGQVGLGGAGFAIARLLMGFVEHAVIASDLNTDAQDRFAKVGGEISNLDEIMETCDLVISTTGVPGLIKPEMIHDGQIILALSNPNPEISPEEALKAGAALATDGRFVNNLLGYPGIWRGAIDAGVRRLTMEMYTAAAHAIAELAPADEILPSPLDKRVHAAVARAVAFTAAQMGLARHPVDEDYLARELEAPAALE